MSEATSVNYSALEKNPSQAELKQFFSTPERKEFAAKKTRSQTILGAIVGVIFGAFIGGSAGEKLQEVSPILPWALMIGSALLIGIAAVGIARGAFRKLQTKIYKMARFAADNGFVYARSSAEPLPEGIIFNAGHSRALTNLFQKEGLRVMNYQYTTGSGRYRQDHFFGVIEVKLPRRLPNMVLDARKNNFFGFSNLPSGLKRDQRLSLEGDFDKYFTLYCPKEYARDALYIFTPDLMTKFIDYGATFDAEVIDDRLFVYYAGVFELSAQPAWRQVFSIIDTIAEKTVSQSTNYADTRVGDRQLNQVAEPGKRLKVRRVSVIATIALIILYAIITVIRMISGE